MECHCNLGSWTIGLFFLLEFARAIDLRWWEGFRKWTSHDLISTSGRPLDFPSPSAPVPSRTSSFSTVIPLLRLETSVRWPFRYYCRPTNARSFSHDPWAGGSRCLTSAEILSNPPRRLSSTGAHYRHPCSFSLPLPVPNS